MNHSIYMGLMLLLFSSSFAPVVGVTDRISMTDEVCHQQETVYNEQHNTAVASINSAAVYVVQDDLMKISATALGGNEYGIKSHRPLARRAAL
ncbi:hypothetical protein OS175_13405 [Marinicella sp. S1101]|uniref:hypothetical protein n=1 Tax=Marinicella marina TaxID=2996016 RepID=UPI002260F4F8|nr:hypothetical protein [Marinicella marina]MCX7554871.1 hypothetical protein [Marinicella marina]MDJ1141529.1 hypothetical protein [Marinicella marina]